MRYIELTIRTKTRVFQDRFAVNKLVAAGFTGRDKDVVRAHIEELKKAGVKAPDILPVFYEVSGLLLTKDDVIEVPDAMNTGEVEYVLFFKEGTVYLGVGSDHTDRELERTDILKSKQVCAKVVAPEVWPLEEVLDHWDRLALRSWIRVEGETRRYQDGTLAMLIEPLELAQVVEERLSLRKPGSLNGYVIFSGTIGTLSGQLERGDVFIFELEDPVLGRKLSHRYEIVSLKSF